MSEGISNMTSFTGISNKLSSTLWEFLPVNSETA